MLAYVAFREGSVNGVGDGVQAHIGVGMALQPASMRDDDAAKHHMVAGAEPVHIKAVASSYIHIARLFVLIICSQYLYGFATSGATGRSCA